MMSPALAEEVPGGGPLRRRPPRPDARRPRLRAAPGRSPTPIGTGTASTGSSTSTTASGPTTPTTSSPPGDTGIARPWAGRTPPSAEIAAEAGISPGYLETVWDVLDGPAEAIGPIAASEGIVARAADARGRRRRGRPGRLRADAGPRRRPPASSSRPEVENLTARGINTGTQPFVLWKNRRMAANRMRYAGGASAIRPRGLDPEGDAARALAVPDDPDDFDRFEATFDRFCATFPDAFFISERARVYLDPEQEKDNTGRLLERRLPQHDRLLPRRRAALRAAARRRRPPRAGPALGRVRLHHRRPDAAVFELSLVRAGRDRLHARRPRLRLRPRRGHGRRLRGQDGPARRGLPRQGPADRRRRGGDPGDRGPVPDHRRRRSAGSSGSGSRPSPATSTPSRIWPSGPSAAPSTGAERAGVADFYRALRDRGRPRPRGRRPRHARRHPDVAPLPLPGRPGRRTGRAIEPLDRITTWPAA